MGPGSSSSISPGFSGSGELAGESHHGKKPRTGTSVRNTIADSEIHLSLRRI